MRIQGYLHEIVSRFGIGFNLFQCIEKCSAFFGVITAGHCFAHSTLDRISSFSGHGVDGSTTPYAHGFIMWCFLTATTAFNRCQFFIGRLRNLYPMQLGVLSRFVLASESRYIPGDGFRVARTPLSVFNKCSVGTLPGQPGRVRLSEICGCNRLFHTRAVGENLKNIKEAAITQWFWLTQLAPQWGIRVVRFGVIAEPLRYIWLTRNKGNASRASFPRDTNLQAIVNFRKIAYSQFSKFTTSRTRIKRHSGHSGITRICSRVNHWLYVFIPTEHFGRVGRGVIVGRQTDGHPFNGIRNLITFRGSTGVDAERNAIIPVGFWVVIGSVYPGNDFLTHISVNSRFSKRDVGFFAHARAVAKQFLAAVVGIFRVQQRHSIIELQQNLSISFRTATLAGFEIFTQRFNVLFGSHTTLVDTGDCEVFAQSQGRDIRNSFTIPYIKGGLQGVTA